MKKMDPMGRPIDMYAHYFVLRLDTDKHALAAMNTYANSVVHDNPILANDIYRWIAEIKKTNQKTNQEENNGNNKPDNRRHSKGDISVYPEKNAVVENHDGSGDRKAKDQTLCNQKTTKN